MIANAGVVMSIRLQSVRVSGVREYPFDTLCPKRVGSFSTTGRSESVVHPPSLTGGRQKRVLATPPHLRLNRMRRLFPALVIVITFGCGDSSGPRVKPASIEIVQAPGGPFYAGLPLPVEPTFVVKDQNGNPIAGVALSISVSAGGGTVT